MANKTTFSERELMELAIQIMKKTVHEPRNDGKVGPSVGAVIYKPDGSVQWAYRGELREGDHAEYTLLDRKNFDTPLDNCVLFTTLEPCAPGSRHPPKLSCSERIVQARIKEVWVGIEDPDPAVDRRGIEYLRKRDINVHMFDRDLQEIIHEENKDFITQAEQRATGVEKKEIFKVKLSNFEDTVENIKLEDLSTEVLNQYRKDAKIVDQVGSESFTRTLLHLGLGKKDNDTFKPTFFGVLLFGKQPRNLIPQAGLLGKIHFPNGEDEINEFNEPLVLIPGLVENWLKNKMSNIINRSQMVREEREAFLRVVVREGIVNALIHRDYDIKGAKCQLEVTEDTITVKSPGSPPPPITLEQMQSFNAPMLSRNPVLHYVFRQMKLAEEQGIGLKSLKSAAEKYHLPLPTYKFEDPYLILTFYRSMESVIQVLSPEILRSLNEEQKEGWQFLTSKTKITMTEYAGQMGFKERKAQRHLQKFVTLGLLHPIRAGRSTEYQILR